jgi:hypothetical protein
VKISVAITQEKKGRGREEGGKRERDTRKKKKGTKEGRKKERKQASKLI